MLLPTKTIASSTQRAWALPARLLTVPLLVIVLVAGFVVAPWSFETKAHAALHGHCAQRPSHSLLMGDRLLPFDARMTGIYGGFLATSLYLALRGRYDAFRAPSRRVVATLAIFVGALAFDGTNSLLVDLHLGHAYTPANELRLLTGLLTGIALAVAICFILATTLWRDGNWDQAVVGSARELGLVAALQVPFAAIVLSVAGWLYVPVATLLVLSAVTVVAALAGVVIVLMRGGDRSFTALAQLNGSAAAALIAGVVVMAGIAGGRFLLEWWLNIPTMT